MTEAKNINKEFLNISDPCKSLFCHLTALGRCKYYHDSTFYFNDNSILVIEKEKLFCFSSLLEYTNSIQYKNFLGGKYDK